MKVYVAFQKHTVDRFHTGDSIRPLQVQLQDQATGGVALRRPASNVYLCFKRGPLNLERCLVDESRDFVWTYPRLARVRVPRASKALENTSRSCPKYSQTLETRPSIFESREGLANTVVGRRHVRHARHQLVRASGANSHEKKNESTLASLTLTLSADDDDDDDDDDDVGINDGLSCGKITQRREREREREREADVERVGL